MSWWDRLLGRPLKYDLSISDPAFAALLQMSTTGLGVYSTYEALRNPAFYRGVALIAGAIASLPLKTYRTDPDTGERTPSQSFIDSTPSGPYGLTPFTWKQLLVTYYVTGGEVGLMHVHNAVGALIGLWPVPSTGYEVKWEKDSDGDVHKTFDVYTAEEGPKRMTDDCDGDTGPGGEFAGCFTQIMGMSLDGRRGVSPIVLFRRNIELAHAQEVAAMRTMTSGMMNRGVLTTPDEDVTEDDAKAIEKQINDKMAGPEKAGSVPFINRKIEFTSWQMNNIDAQFLQGRQFSVEDVGRMLGVPLHLLMSLEKQTSWGTGVAEQNAALHKYTLAPITSTIEESVSSLLSQPKHVEFNYKGFLQGTPAEEVNLLLAQTGKPFLTTEEARQILNLSPTPELGELAPAEAPPVAAPKITVVPTSGKGQG